MTFNAYFLISLRRQNFITKNNDTPKSLEKTVWATELAILNAEIYPHIIGQDNISGMGNHYLLLMVLKTEF